VTRPAASFGSETPDVSVILPAYNAARCLERAVRSALAQEGVSLEIVVVDDASTDATWEVASRLAAEDGRVRLLRNEVNGGAAISRNRACEAARGEWLAVLDADDAYLPGRLVRLVTLAEAEGLDVLADMLLLYDLEAGKQHPRQYQADGRLERIGLPRLIASIRPQYGMLKPIFRRRLVENGIWHYPEQARYTQDFLAYFNCLLAGCSFGVLHEPLYLFSMRIGKSGRFSPGSVTPVDHIAAIAHTRALMDRVERERIDPPGTTRAEVLELLQDRIRTLENLNQFYGWHTLRTGAWARHWKWLRQDARNPRVLMELVISKTAARLRLQGR
jgi:succinoglycan biosynthesis protein ExoO